MKKSVKAIIAGILVLAMSAGLCACGSTESGSKGGKDTENNDAPDYVYVSEYTKIDGLSDYFSILSYDEEGFYTLVNEVVGKNIPEGAVEEYEGQYDVYENALYRVGFDGKAEKLNGFEPFKFDSEHEDSDTWTNYCGFFATADGFAAIVDCSETWSDAPAGIEKYSDEWYNYYRYSDDFYIVNYDAEGKILSRNKMQVPDENVMEGYYGYYVSSCALSEDNLLYTAYDQKIYAFNLDGSVNFIMDLGNWTDAVLELNDGRMATMLWSEEDGCYVLAVIDPVSHTVTDWYQFPNNAYDCFTGGGEYDLYYSSGDSFYGYKLETETAEKLFNWINCDVDQYNISGKPVVLSDGTVIAASISWNSDYTESNAELVRVMQKPYSETAQKQTLTLAVYYLDYNARNQVLKFNRNNPDYRINIIDYSEYNNFDSEDGYDAGLTRLNTEIMAGNIPDLIDLGSLSTSRYAARGILEDLYPYIEADPELSLDDLNRNVLRNFENKGKLYQTVAGYSINSVVGASSVVGDTPGWTYNEFNTALASMPEGCTPFNAYTTRADILSNCLSFELDRFIDWESGKCSFDTGEFAGLLEFCANFPAEFDWDNYEWTEDDSEYLRISRGQQMLLNTYIFSFDDVLYYDMYFGGDATYIGYPSNDGTGSYFSSRGGSYAITTACKNKDAAWSFIREFFTEDYQRSAYYFPTNVNCFNEILKEAMTPEYEMVDGNYLLDENGDRIMIAKGTFWTDNNNYVDYYAMTQEQADKLIALIDSIDCSYEYDSELIELITDQATAFFEGQKSAQEVAKLVQSKVNIYVNEQR